MRAQFPPGSPRSIPDRRALVAGLEFLEQSASTEWDPLALRLWFEEHLVQTGCMRAPRIVNEPTAGVVALYIGGPHALMSQRGLPNLLAVTRATVLRELRGLLAVPCDDRFVTTAIFAGRVIRQRERHVSRWITRPELTAPLSSVVLSLFAVDVLSHRDLYDKAFTLCEVCDRITFQQGASVRTLCPHHLAKGSGIMRRTTLGAQPAQPQRERKLA